MILIGIALTERVCCAAACLVVQTDLIVQSPRRAKEVELGHTLFGYVIVQCANCGTVRYYWIFLKVGWAGWTLEVPENELHTLNRMLAKVIYTGEQAISTVDSVIPLEGRKPIE
jgi:hypothetical protein